MQLIICFSATILYIHFSSSFGAKLVIYSESGGVKLKSVHSKMSFPTSEFVTPSQHSTVVLDSSPFVVDRHGSPRIFPRMAKRSHLSKGCTNEKHVWVDDAYIPKVGWWDDASFTDTQDACSWESMNVLSNMNIADFPPVWPPNCKSSHPCGEAYDVLGMGGIPTKVGGGIFKCYV